MLNQNLELKKQRSNKSGDSRQNDSKLFNYIKFFFNEKLTKFKSIKKSELENHITSKKSQMTLFGRNYSDSTNLNEKSQMLYELK